MAKAGKTSDKATTGASMLASQAFKKIQLLAAKKEAQVINSILAALTTVDPTAHLLSVEDACVSRTVSKKLWDALPDEHLAYPFRSIEKLKKSGAHFLIEKRDTPIILHLGWDVLAFATTLRAAWETVDVYYEINTDSYNSCMYPASLDWYVIRAGKNLYPMDCLSGETASLIKREATDSFR